MKVLETSGASDVEPIAHALASHGFRLDCVVAVVDAEEGLSSLKHQVAQHQVRQGVVAESQSVKFLSLANIRVRMRGTKIRLLLTLPCPINQSGDHRISLLTFQPILY